MLNYYVIETALGQTRGDLPLPFLTEDERAEFDSIGYSGKTRDGRKCSRLEFLNSLGRGEFSIQQTRFDNGDFTEEFTIIQHLPDTSKIAWRSVLNTGLKRWGHITAAADAAKLCGYEYFLWNDLVYSTNTMEQTEFKISDIV